MKRMVFGESVQGASHKRVDKECQDSFKKLEYDDGTVIMAIADGHGSKACPYSKSGSSIAVNVFCKVMDEFHASYAENLEMLLTYLNREGDTKVAQAVDAEWKRRVLKVHTNQKREVLLTEDGEKNKAEIYKQYGSTLVGLMITPIFVFAFQLGDGDISYVDQNGLDHLLEDEKILGVETHSLSKIDSWKKVVSAVRRRDEADGLPYMLMLSTDDAHRAWHLFEAGRDSSRRSASPAWEPYSYSSSRSALCHCHVFVHQRIPPRRTSDKEQCRRADWQMPQATLFRSRVYLAR